MELQQIRNATLRIKYGNNVIITDPYLADKHTLPSVTGGALNPIVALPFPQQNVIRGIDMAIISHLHNDHIDTAAERLLPSDLTILCQPGDNHVLESKGFSKVLPVDDVLFLKGMKITRTKGQHGTGKVLDLMGNTSGFVFEAENEPTVYWAGDTIWCQPVAEVINDVEPDIIITHSCGAIWGDQVLIVMDAAQTVAVCRAAPNSIVIATHMESIDHATISRMALRKHADENGIQDEKLLIPEDGEKLFFSQ